MKIPIIAAVTVCTLAGLMVGRISSDNSGPEDTVSKVTGGRLGPRAGARHEGNNRGEMGPRRPGPSIAQMHVEGRHAASANPSMSLHANMQAILDMPNPVERAEAWSRFVKGLDPSEIGEVVADFDFDGKGLHVNYRSEYAMLLEAWAGHDLYAALDYAQNKIGTTHYAHWIVLATWATSDPVAAKRWAEEKHDGKGANPWMVGVIRGIAASDPEYAAELMNSMPRSIARSQASAALLDHYAAMQDDYLKQGAEVAREWALSIKDDGLREEVMLRIADKLAKTDPVGTADWLQANRVVNADRVIGRVIGRMTAEDPQAAVSYFKSISDPKLKAQVMDRISYQVGTENLQGVLSLMDSNPEYVTDRVLQSFAFKIGHKHPVMGANALSRIEDKKQRNSAYRRYLRQWVRHDKEGALNWANQAGLPKYVIKGALKQEVIKGYGPRSG